MAFLFGCGAGFVVWFLYNYLWSGIYTVDQNERAVKTVFGRAQRIEGKTTLSTANAINLVEEERERYAYPQVVVIPPGGPYFKFPWEEIHKVNIATQTLNMAHDPEDPMANHGGDYLEAVTKDQLNTALNGQIRYRVNDQNLYAFLFGVKNPVVHVMAYFISVLRERIANFEAKKAEDDKTTAGISINDLRKNLHEINEHMMLECTQSAARYGITLEASLITSIDPPDEVEGALAAINTAHNEVSSEISLAEASADQKIVQSRRATEIETLRAKSEVEPLKSTALQLSVLKKNGPDVLRAYVRNVKLALYSKVKQVIMEVEK
ncbi:MAG: SPFH domain-containing protein [Candidatus Riflebacteria bacterium]|nr:SPFH domain-containing protein [Candidatus Riflebacteria bacterium]